MLARTGDTVARLYFSTVVHRGPVLLKVAVTRHGVGRVSGCWCCFSSYYFCQCGREAAVPAREGEDLRVWPRSDAGSAGSDEPESRCPPRLARLSSAAR